MRCGVFWTLGRETDLCVFGGILMYDGCSLSSVTALRPPKLPPTPPNPAHLWSISKPSELIGSPGWIELVYHWGLGEKGKLYIFCSKVILAAAASVFPPQKCLWVHAFWEAKRSFPDTTIKIRSQGMRSQMEALGYGILKELWSREGRAFPRCHLAKQTGHSIRQPVTSGRRKEDYFLSHCCL